MRRFTTGLLLHIVVVMALLAAPASAKTLKLVALGDSLTAGYGLGPGQSYPVRLEKALRAKGFDVTIENAGVSGDTTSGGLLRLDWSIPDGTDGVLIELGANDALRGIAPEVTRTSLGRILARLSQRKIPAMLFGMRAPRNLGADYANAFDQIFPDLAQQYGVPLYPFFLDGVVADPALNLADGIHPNLKGIDIIVERTLPPVEAFVRLLQAK